MVWYQTEQGFWDYAALDVGQAIRSEVMGVEFRLWEGQQLQQLISLDTETRMIRQQEIPQLALITVCDRERGFFIPPSRLGEFLAAHSSAHYVAHNAVFDFWVCCLYLQDTQSPALGLWWEALHRGRIHCTMLLDQLILLADCDTEPRNRNLALVAKAYAALDVDKEDPYRTRYAELLELGEENWYQAEQGFWDYAALDVVSTLRVFLNQVQRGRAHTRKYTTQIAGGEVYTHPGAEAAWGVLTESLQVRGAVALDYLSRRGVSLDRKRAEQLKGDVIDLVSEGVQKLEALSGAELFQRWAKKSKVGTPGELKITDAGVPRRKAKEIKAQLERVAHRLSIKPPTLKNGSITDSVSWWAPYADQSEFVAVYCTHLEQAKLAQFFTSLESDQCYPRYRPLVRTGRTSCSSPNLQQLPRDSRFRELICAPPGCCLMQCDYSAIELRTLAQIAVTRLGQSKLAELFIAGIDPHKYTAAVIAGISLEQFEELDHALQKQLRQKSKAASFGFSGGLGAAAFLTYAASAYGVVFTLDEAQEMKQRLCFEVYPEIGQLLSQSSAVDLCENLALASTEQIPLGWAECRELQQLMCVDPEALTDEERATLQGWYHWLNTHNQSLELAERIRGLLSGRTPSTPELMRRIFYGSACTLTGRVRGHVGYTQRANTPFQGLAADGNKLALLELLRNGFDVRGFVHDEVLIYLPYEEPLAERCWRVEQIMISQMARVCPDVPIACEWLVADRWYKAAPPQQFDKTGEPIVYTGEN